jgi:hypothetical protein
MQLGLAGLESACFWFFMNGVNEQVNFLHLHLHYFMKVIVIMSSLRCTTSGHKQADLGRLVELQSKP